MASDLRACPAREGNRVALFANLGDQVFGNSLDVVVDAVRAFGRIRDQMHHVPHPCTGLGSQVALGITYVFET